MSCFPRTCFSRAFLPLLFASAGVTLLAAPKDAESTLPVVVLEDTVLAAGSGKTVDDGVVVTVTLGRTSRTMVTPPLHGLQDTAVACMLALFTC